jgi:lipoprotein signal peptidase
VLSNQRLERAVRAKEARCARISRPNAATQAFRWTTSSTRRQGWLLLALVTIDATLKIVAFRTLPTGIPTHRCLICVVLRVNSVGLGSAAQSIVASQGLRTPIFSSVFCAVLAVSLVIAAARARLTKRTIGLSLLAALASSLIFTLLFPSIGHLHSPGTIAALRACVVSLWLVIWALSASPFWKAGALLCSAAGISNLLSLAYPPYRIVDYLWSTPLNGLIGLGVFNVADLYGFLALPVFSVALVVSVVRRVYSRRRQLSGMQV